MTLTVPRFSRTAADFKLKNDAFNLYKVIQYARERALTEGRDFRVRFRFDKNDYQILRGPDFKPIEGRFGKVFVVSKDLSLRGREKDWTCYSDGNCDVASVLIRGQEGGYEISAEGFGGTIHMREISYEA